MNNGLPSDGALRAAERIILVDPHRPGWYQPLYSSLFVSPTGTLEIPVDSADDEAIQQWRERIRALNLND